MRPPEPGPIPAGGADWVQIVATPSWYIPDSKPSQPGLV